MADFIALPDGGDQAGRDGEAIVLATAPFARLGIAELAMCDPTVVGRAGGGRTEQARSGNQPVKAASEHTHNLATVVGTPFRLARLGSERRNGAAT